MSVNKRKLSYQGEYNESAEIEQIEQIEFNINNFDRNKSKKIRIHNNEQIDICKICGFGKINGKFTNLFEICRCIVNTNDVNYDGMIIKMCNFCNDPVSLCECNVGLWSLYNCNTCMIAHSVYDNCLLNRMCIICNKYSTYTQNGCRCMNENIKFVKTDINLKNLVNNTDYADFLDKDEFQPVCQMCECHLSKCICFGKIEETIDYELTEEDYKDEYEQMFYD